MEQLIVVFICFFAFALPFAILALVTASKITSKFKIICVIFGTMFIRIVGIN